MRAGVSPVNVLRRHSVRLRLRAGAALALGAIVAIPAQPAIAGTSTGPEHHQGPRTSCPPPAGVDITSLLTVGDGAATDGTQHGRHSRRPRRAPRRQEAHRAAEPRAAADSRHRPSPRPEGRVRLAVDAQPQDARGRDRPRLHQPRASASGTTPARPTARAPVQQPVVAARRRPAGARSGRQPA